jgi:hypothetical protein
MLIWGSAGKSRDIRDAGMKQCNVCGQNRPFKYSVNYTMRHLWYLLRWSTGRNYTQYCTICGYGLPVDEAQINAHNLTGEKVKNPIPFFDRLGWAVCLGVIALSLTSGVMMVRADNKEDAKFIAAPKIGDLYTIDVDRFLPKDALSNNSFGGDYGVFRVAQINGGQIVLDLPKVIYSRIGGPQDDIRDGKAKDAGYYDGQMTQPVSAMIGYQKDDIIRDVDRN